MLAVRRLAGRQGGAETDRRRHRTCEGRPPEGQAGAQGTLIKRAFPACSGSGAGNASKNPVFIAISANGACVASRKCSKIKHCLIRKRSTKTMAIADATKPAVPKP